MKPYDERLLSRAEVEELFGISKRFLESRAGSVTGPRFVRVGRLVRYKLADIHAWIEENRV
ncbi:helix-turn-helix domain-containing protein [uncultured Ruegeria sp.]|jgi:predicted DNA-binding transcriptional regulator AlpA|uniref:helix-turn-helix transcriptional regulator n=1 Tax=uncultured Ruegeria sp. TaxID=259304 RepID=UPI0026055227|nr:helix-turn-helix domain-containing protein [uncultured Ruegeria sp.]